MTKTVFKLNSLSKHLKTRQEALAKITNFGKLFTMVGDKDNYVYIDANSIRDLVSPSLYRELSANCTQLVVNVTNLNRF